MARWCIRLGVHSTKAMVLLLLVLLAFCMPYRYVAVVALYTYYFSVSSSCMRRWRQRGEMNQWNEHVLTDSTALLAGLDEPGPGWSRRVLVSRLVNGLNGRSPPAHHIMQNIGYGVWGPRLYPRDDVDIETIFEERLQQLMASYNGSHFSKLVWSRSFSSTVFRAICARLDNWCYLVKWQWWNGVCLTDSQQFWS